MAPPNSARLAWAVRNRATEAFRRLSRKAPLRPASLLRPVTGSRALPDWSSWYWGVKMSVWLA